MKNFKLILHKEESKLLEKFIKENDYSQQEAIFHLAMMIIKNCNNFSKKNIRNNNDYKHYQGRIPNSTLNKIKTISKETNTSMSELILTVLKEERSGN